MRILYTNEVDIPNLSRRDQLYFYNGLDCLICREVFDEIFPMLDETTNATYRFMFNLQAPALEMTLRGCLVDPAEKFNKIKDVEEDLLNLEATLNKFADACWGAPLNARSYKQKLSFFYDFAGCKKITTYNKYTKETKPTTDRSAIEKIHERHPELRPITNCIMRIMDLSKTLGTLRTGIDKDGYFRAAFNVAGTETGRFSSKRNAFGTGSNFQNIPEHLRSIFAAPTGPISNRRKYNLENHTT